MVFLRNKFGLAGCVVGSVLLFTVALLVGQGTASDFMGSHRSLQTEFNVVFASSDPNVVDLENPVLDERLAVWKLNNRSPGEKFHVVRNTPFYVAVHQKQNVGLRMVASVTDLKYFNFQPPISFTHVGNKDGFSYMKSVLTRDGEVRFKVDYMATAYWGNEYVSESAERGCESEAPLPRIVTVSPRTSLTPDEISTVTDGKAQLKFEYSFSRYFDFEFDFDGQEGSKCSVKSNDATVTIKESVDNVPVKLFAPTCSDTCKLVINCTYRGARHRRPYSNQVALDAIDYEVVLRPVADKFTPTADELAK